MAAFFNRPVATPLQRIVCYGCDGLILINAWLISLIAYGPESTPAAIVGSFLAYYFVYYMGFMVGFGATPAKLVLRTRIVRNLGERPEPAVLLLRYVVFLLTLGVPFGAFCQPLVPHTRPGSPRNPRPYRRYHSGAILLRLPS